MKNGLLDKIRSRGFWRINFQPRLLLPEKSLLSACSSAVERNAPKLRGWQYPYVPVRNDDHQGSLPSGEFFEAWIDWQNHIEYWRAYRSHQFLHYLALREDWLSESDWEKDNAVRLAPGQALGTIRTVWQITEIFEFLARLGRHEFYPTGAIVSITLQNIRGRSLWMDDPYRMPFLDQKTTGAERIEIVREIPASKIAGDSIENAESVLIELFDNFGWSNPSRSTIRSQQEQLLSGKV